MKKYTTQSVKSVRRRRPSQGFTLIEVMVVLFILLALASASVLAVQSYRASARQKTAELFIRAMETPLETFNTDIGRYPTTEEGLGALLSPPPTLTNPAKWSGPYVKENVSGFDPWDNPYQYEYPGRRSSTSYDLWSSGPDGISDTDDDICSWK